MDIAIRPACDDDFAAIADLDAASFGFQYSEQDLVDARALLELDRFYVATDGERIVGVTGDFPFTMTVPGGQLQVPGVTWVSVDATCRRRGVLRELMTRQLSDYRATGIVAAILTASEGGIYGRFGYGAASTVRKTVIERRRVRLLSPGDAGAVVRASPQLARQRMPGIHQRWRDQTPGALERTEAWWDFLCLDRESQRDGMSGLFYLLHADGYVAYRIKEDWADGEARHLCRLTDYVMATSQAHADLWQVMLGLDLVGSIESHRIPIDDPLSLMVDNPRQIRTTTVADGIWIRPLDVAAMLAARRYAVEVDLVLEVRDGLFGDGRYHLRGGADAAQCERTERASDLVIDAAGLGAAYLGGLRLQALARAGRVQAADEAALIRLDRALLADRLPVHGTAF